MHKLTRFLPGCGKPSPTSDDVASTSGGRRGQSSHASAAPEQLSRRNSSEATAAGQRPRGTSKLVHTMKEARHSVAVALHLSKSRSRPPQPNPDAATTQEPPRDRVTSGSVQPPLSPSASLIHDSEGGRSPTIYDGRIGSLSWQLRRTALGHEELPPPQDAHTWNMFLDGPKPMAVSETVATRPVPDDPAPPRTVPETARTWVGFGEQAKQPTARTQDPQIGRSLNSPSHSNTGLSSQELNSALVTQLPPTHREETPRHTVLMRETPAPEIVTTTPFERHDPEPQVPRNVEPQHRDVATIIATPDPSVHEIVPVVTPERHPSSPVRLARVSTEVVPPVRETPHRIESTPTATPEPTVHEIIPAATLETQPSSSSRIARVSTEVAPPLRQAQHRIESTSIATPEPLVREIVSTTPPVTGRSRRTHGRVTPEPNTPPANNQAGPSESTPAGNPLPWNSHTGELRSRRRVLTDTATQVAQQTMATVTQAARDLHLPQVKQAVADASITRAIGSTAKGLVKPTARLAAQTASTLGQSGASWLNRKRLSSEPLQQALGGDLKQQDAEARAQAQAHAHREAVQYGKHAATVLDTALPVLHAMLKIGGAGTSMAFGLGRNSGMAAGDALGRLERGAPQAPGLRAGPELPAAALSSDTALKLGATGLQQWLLGAATGAVGNMAGQYLAAPLVNLIPRQFQKIDDLAVLPQESQDLMNLLQPGAGDALRAQVLQAQNEIGNIDSESNKTLGKIAFGSVFAARFASMATPLGAAGQVLTGLVMSAGAGMGIGAVMATRQATTTLEIPDLEELFRAVEANPHNGEAALAAVPKHAVPLFYAKQTPTAPTDRPQPDDIETGNPVTTADAPQRGRLATIANSTLDAVKWSAQTLTQPLAVVGQAWAGSLSASPLIEPALPGTDEGVSVRRVLGTASNVAASGLNRAQEMAASTAMTSLLSTGAAILSAGTDGPARRVALAVLNSVGIQFAIEPWFNALTTSIPKFDAGVKAHRAEVVNGPAGP